MPLPSRPVASLRSFGRRAQGFAPSDAPRAANAFTEEARLFALTFAGGFLFMSVYLA